MLSARTIESRDDAATERRQLVLVDVAVGAKIIQNFAHAVFANVTFLRERVHVRLPVAELHEHPCRERLE
jgi:hypothetical protein